MKSNKYGAWTAASRAANAALGDKTGRTVSRRTTHGIKRAFNLKASDETVEVFAHAAMIGTYAMLRSKNEKHQILGGVSLFGLVLAYHIGK